jgi:ATP-binding cassette subfamily C protein
MATITANPAFDLLAAEGEEVIVGGNTPFLMDGADKVWVVASGRVEVFAVNVVDGHPDGTRHHYLTADPGDAIFGIDLERYGEGLGFLAVGMVGTRLRLVPLERVQAVARDEKYAEGLAGIVDRWVIGLSRGVSRTIIPQPRADATLAAGEEVEITDGQRVRARKLPVWVRHIEGNTLLIGMEEIAGADGFAFPLTNDTFFQSLGAAKLAAYDTAQALAHQEGWRGLEAFYETLFRAEFFNTRLAAADELNRLQDKAAKDRRSRAQAINDLVSILDPKKGGFTVTDSDDPLFRAAALVASRIRMTLKAPPKPKDGDKTIDPLGDIARASRMRMRRVVLKGRWWNVETTPLLGYIEDGEVPVALLPSGHGHFEIHDPTARTVKRLTKADAQTIKPIAFQFYRSFPDQLREAGDVVRFGLAGNTGDLYRPFMYGMVSGVLALLIPQITGRIVDRIIPEASRSSLVQMAAILTAVGFSTAMLDVARRIGLLRLETKMSAAVAPAMWDRLIALPVSFFRKYSSGDLAARVGGVDRIRQTLSGVTTTSLMLSIFSVLYLAQMFYYSYQLAFLAIGMVVVILLVTGWCAMLKLRIHRDVVKIEGKISGLVLQLLTGIPKLRVAAAESRAFAEWSKAFSAQKRLHEQGELADIVINVFNSMFTLITSITVFALMWHLTKQAIADGEAPLSIGDFVAFQAAFATMLAQTLQMGLQMMTVMTVIPMFERSRPILEAIPEVDPTKSDPGDLNGHIEASHLSFRYSPDGPLILNDVSLEIPAGKYIALVGPSGSGKSTMLRMMLGLEQPESGAIYYDARDLSQLDVQKLRRRIGVVIQNGKIRQGSIYENIVGSQPLSQDEAWEAARSAGLEEDIERMAMGMHTVLQQGGGQLSGGQRQRLMIARAIVNKPRILFLDEATSALDNRTQAIVADSMNRMQATRVAIAHRLSTIINADVIYVMAAGRVVQAGSYEELVNQKGMFADLVRRQIA